MSEISIVARRNDSIEVEVFAGARIDDVCAEAVSLAAAQNIPVRFDFNGVSLEATPSSNAEALADLFRTECERRHDAWKASDAGKQHAADEAKRKTENQAKADELLASLPAALSSMDRTVAWVGEFSLVSDQGAVFNKSDLIRQLEAAGYARNAYVGDPAVKTEREAFAQWVVGQVLDGLYHGAIQPAAAKFAADYVAAFGHTATH